MMTQMPFTNQLQRTCLFIFLLLVLFTSLNIHRWDMELFLVKRNVDMDQMAFSIKKKNYVCSQLIVNLQER